MHKKVSLTLLVACTLAFAPAASGARIELGAREGADATVGCLFPMTGRGGLYGRDSVVAMNMALDEIAARGDGYPRVRVLVEDSKSRPSLGAQLAQRFIDNDKVDFLCGVVSSAVALAVTDIAHTRKVIFVGTDHASSRLTGEAFHRYYFRVSNDGFQSMDAGARYLQELQAKTGWQRIAFIGPDYEYGYRAWADLRRVLDELGVKYQVVAELWPKLFEADYAAYIAALIEAGPDIVINGHWGGDLSAFIRQAKTFDLFRKARLCNFDSGGNYEVMADLGDEMPLGLCLSARHHNNWPDSDLNRRFVNEFRERSGRYPSYAAEGAYAGILAIAEAVRKAGGTRNTDRLITALEGMRIKLPEDPEGFTSYIDPATHQIQQVTAIGEVVPNDRYPPARAMLGNWKIYYPRKGPQRPAAPLSRDTARGATGT